MASGQRFPQEAWAVLHDGREAVGHIQLTFQVVHEDGAWQGVCRELDVPSFGDGPGEALDNVLDATICYLNAIEEAGERERVFRERLIVINMGVPSEDAHEEPVGPGQLVSRLDLALAVGG